MKLPEVRISHGWLIDPMYERGTKTYFKRRGWIYNSAKATRSRVSEYERAWAKYDQQLLSAMCEVLRLRFYQNVIDVHLVGGGVAVSKPMVISSQYPPQSFVDVLTHELHIDC